MAEEVRLSEDDYGRIMKCVRDAVRDEFASIGLHTADPEKRIKTILAIEFLMSLYNGANAAKRVAGRRIINGTLYLIGVVIALWAGALLEKTIGR